MAKNSNPFQTVTLSPLAGLLDTRSRPSDIPAGAFRWKQNVQISHEGRLSRRAGHSKAFSDAVSFTNHDYHNQGREVREPVNFQFESTSSAGIRRYFIGTQSTVLMLNETTGLYTDILTSKGTDGTRWKAAELKDTILFTNNHDDVRAYDYDAGTIYNSIDSLKNQEVVTAAKIVVQFQGFLILMNVVQDGVRFTNRVLWCDLNLPLNWAVVDVDNILTGNQDLDPGEVDPVLKADRLINLPVVKDHGLNRLTCCMKNLYGVLGGSRGRLHQNIHISIADLAVAFRPTLTVVDATRVMLRGGPQGGRLDDLLPVGAVAAGTDMVALDAWGATLLGIDPKEIDHIVLAQGRGLGTFGTPLEEVHVGT